jgi:hypothetical protein
MLDPRGTQAPGECIATCKGIVPHNCGQLNGTVACGTVIINGCNVCDRCCRPWLTEQGSGDGCFAVPVPNGERVRESDKPLTAHSALNTSL